MGRIRTKMIDSDIYKLDSGYHDFYRMKFTCGYATAFVFDKLTQKDIVSIQKWKNTKIQKLGSTYAPEIIRARVVLFDKIPKAVI